MNDEYMVFFLSVATDKNPKDCVRKNVGAVPRKLFAVAYGCEHYPIVGLGNSLLEFVLALQI